MHYHICDVSAKNHQLVRPLRIEYESTLYHVTARGNHRDSIYEDDSDRERFLELLGESCRWFNWICYAYCLMGKHYHLFVETPGAN